jgi:hypothetical protein
MNEKKLHYITDQINDWIDYRTRTVLYSIQNIIILYIPIILLLIVIICAPCCEYFLRPDPVRSDRPGHI